jgi:diguanylate cyclase (GGDEF)-like protein
MKLGAKTSLLLTALVLLVISGTTLFILGHQLKGVKALLLKNMETEAAALASETRMQMEEHLRDTVAIAGNLPRAMLAPDAVEPLTEYLTRQRSFFPKFENGLFVLGPDGRMLADSPAHPELHGQSFANRDYFQTAISRQGGVISQPYVSARTGVPVITFAVPVYSPPGKLLAVTCSSVNLLSFSGAGGLQHRVGQSGYVYIVDAGKRFIQHPDRARLLTALGDGVNEFLDRAVMGFEGSGETLNSQGVRMLVAARHIPELGWVALAQMPATAVTGVMFESVLPVGLFFLATLVVVLPAGVLVMRRIAKPLEELEAAARTIARDLRGGEDAASRTYAAGALSAMRKMGASDEIGGLARAFFQLSARLKRTLGSLRSALDDWERTFSSVQEALLVLNADGKVVRINRVVEDRFRTVKLDAVGRSWQDVLAMGSPPPGAWPSMEQLKEAGRMRFTSEMPGKPGVYELHFAGIQGRREIRGFMLTVADVTEKHQSEERIRRLAFHDPLTKLPNRILLADRLDQAMAAARRNETQVGVMFLDLDDFKKVNDTHGHDAGDEALRQAAVRMAACLRESDTLARYAGDEFMAVLMDLGGEEEARAIAARIGESFKEPFDLSGRKARVGVSIGMAFYPRDGETAEDVMRAADSLMYRNKGRAKGQAKAARQDDRTRERSGQAAEAATAGKRGKKKDQGAPEASLRVSGDLPKQ